jgi:hypothetical protein
MARAGARARSRSSPERWIDRVLALAADGAPDAAAARLRALRRFLLAWGAVRSWVWLVFDPPGAAAPLAASAAVLSVAAALAWLDRAEHHAARLALPALLVELAATLPLTPNHFFLELYAVALLALAGPLGRDAPLVLSGLRWLVAIVLFHTGLQKLLHGYYPTGDFLAFMVGRGDRFADLFRWLLPAAEVARLESYEPLRSGAGPYRVTAPLFVLVSNAIWIAELVLPFGLVARRTRLAAATAATALVVAIQLGAREAGFALLFVNLLLLFVPPRVARALLPAFLALLAFALAAAGGLVPGRSLVETWHLW